MSKLNNFAELEKKLGYQFQNIAFLERALTHRSFAYECLRDLAQSNEPLEFLGDAVLGFIVSFWIFETFPSLNEGKLSKIKAYLVSARILAKRAEILSLGSYLKINRGEEKTGGRFKQALIVDAYEAIIAAIYLDGGLAAATTFVRRELYSELNNLNIADLSVTDYKSALQEYLQALRMPIPDYVVTQTLGPEHDRIFLIELRISNERIATGKGSALKLAHQEAAREALTKLKLLRDVSPTLATK
jgi:ribonuclease-3